MAPSADLTGGALHLARQRARQLAELASAHEHELAALLGGGGASGDSPSSPRSPRRWDMQQQASGDVLIDVDAWCSRQGAPCGPSGCQDFATELSMSPKSSTKVRLGEEVVPKAEEAAAASQAGRPPALELLPSAEVYSAAAAAEPATSEGRTPRAVSFCGLGDEEPGSPRAQGPVIPGLRPTWAAPPSLINLPLSHSNSLQISQSYRRARAGDMIAHKNILASLVTPPYSMKRIFWDVLSAFAIAYDSLTFPLTAFEYDKELIAHRAGAATTVFWTIDCVASFFCGYHRSDGLIEMRMQNIAKKYLSTWFTMDIIIIVTEWALLILGGESQAVGATRIGKALRTVRITRMFRMLRLLRVVKLAQIMDDLADLVVAAPLLTIVNIFKLLIGLAMIVHFIACGWYAIGIWNYEMEYNSWLSPLQDESAGRLYCYLVAYHWSMAQFTPAPNNYHPGNWRERLYAVCVLFLGLVLFSSLLGSTTALINQSKQQAYAQMRQDDLMRRFFKDNEVSMALGNRITHFLKENSKRKRRVAEHDLTCLQALPKSLRTEMHFEVYARVLDRHPVFAKLESLQQPTLVKVCHQAVAEVTFAKGEEPFYAQMPGSHMMWIVDGVLEYHVGVTSSVILGQGSGTKKLIKGAWICETVLWTQWTHKGLLLATCTCGVAQLDGEQFGSVVAEDVHALAYCREFALTFIKVLSNTVISDGDVDDTFNAFDYPVRELMPYRHAAMSSSYTPMSAMRTRRLSCLESLGSETSRSTAQTP